VPKVTGFVFTDNIEAYYARKLYTSNLGHAVLAYLGHLNGLKYVYEAMDDAEIRSHLAGILAAVRDAFLRTYNMPAAELDEHVVALLSWRYSNRDLADTIARVARGPLRKLGPKERLVGVARMLEKCSRPTEGLSMVIAAAMKYRDETDPESGRLERIIAEQGAGAVLEGTCGFARDERLYKECMRFYEKLR
jgi:mannitol-1-phosphate 5-dehydrogenase